MVGGQPQNYLYMIYIIPFDPYAGCQYRDNLLIFFLPSLLLDLSLGISKPDIPTVKKKQKKKRQGGHRAERAVIISVQTVRISSLVNLLPRNPVPLYSRHPITPRLKRGPLSEPPTRKITLSLDARPSSPSAREAGGRNAVKMKTQRVK